MASTVSDTFADIYEEEYKDLKVVPTDFSESEDFRSTLGMSEMEWAAKRMVEMCAKKKNTWCVQFYLSDFEDKDNFTDEGLKTGFLCLLHHGWMKGGVYNGGFLMKKELIERLTKALHRGAARETTNV